jgi:ABC-type iron transport system FetAB permease component
MSSAGVLAEALSNGGIGSQPYAPDSAHSLEASGRKDIVDIPLWKLFLIVVLMAIPLFASIVTKLDLHRYLVLAAVRCIVQVLALGAILSFLFEKDAPLWTAAYLLFMMTVSSLEAVSRPTKSYQVRKPPVYRVDREPL